MTHNWVTIKIYRETRRKAKEMAAQRELSLADLFVKSLVALTTLDEVYQKYGDNWEKTLMQNGRISNEVQSN